MGGWDLGGEVEMPKPPVPEESILEGEVKDLVRVLKEGDSVRRLRVRIRRWPRWSEPNLAATVATTEKQPKDATEPGEAAEVTVQMMLEIFQPLVQLDSIGNNDVEVIAEALSDKEESNLVHEFVCHFNQSRREWLQKQHETSA